MRRHFFSTNVLSLAALAAITACGGTSGENFGNDGAGGSAGADPAGCLERCFEAGGDVDACNLACEVTGGSGGSGATSGAGGGGNTGNVGGMAGMGGTGNTGNVGGMSGGGGTGGGGPTGPVGKCSDPIPPGAQTPPPPKAYTGGSCPTLMPGTNTIMSQGNSREFILMVPEDLDPSETNLPIVFMWHWLQGSANSFVSKGEVQAAVNDNRFIAVLPEKKGDVGFPLPFIPLDLVWPYDTAQSAARQEEEFVFFDDMLACVNEQYSVNLSCVSSAGVSAGALWMGQLLWGRGEYLSSVLSLSGGVGGSFIKPYQPSPHKMPVFSLWGGPGDVCGVIIQFEPMTLELEQNLTNDGHFLVECQHNCGHGVPPFTPPPGLSKFHGMWQFAFDHPYWLADGDSPYLTDGLPEGVPDWCGIGMGSAVPRTDPLCEEEGCPL